MPIRQGGRLARKLSSWLRESLRLSTMAPQLSTPIRWKTFLPISIPITAISELHLADFVCAGMNVLLAVSAPQGRWGTAGPFHYYSGQNEVYTFFTRIRLSRTNARGRLRPFCPSSGTSPAGGPAEVKLVVA